MSMEGRIERNIPAEKLVIDKLALELSKLLKERKTANSSECDSSKKRDARIKELQDEISVKILGSDISHRIQINPDAIARIGLNEAVFFSPLFPGYYPYDLVIDVFNDLIGLEKEKNNFYDYERQAPPYSFIRSLSIFLNWRKKSYLNLNTQDELEEINVVWENEICRLSREILKEEVEKYKKNNTHPPKEKDLESLIRQSENKATFILREEYRRVRLDAPITDGDGNEIMQHERTPSEDYGILESLEREIHYLYYAPIILEELYLALDTTKNPRCSSVESTKYQIFGAAFSHDIINITEKSKQPTHNLNLGHKKDYLKKKVIDRCQEFTNILLTDQYFDKTRNENITVYISKNIFKVMELLYIIFIKGGIREDYRDMKGVIEPPIKEGINLEQRQSNIADSLSKSRGTVQKYLGKSDGNNSEYDLFKDKIIERANERYYGGKA